MERRFCVISFVFVSHKSVHTLTPLNLSDTTLFIRYYSGVYPPTEALDLFSLSRAFILKYSDSKCLAPEFPEKNITCYLVTSHFENKPSQDRYISHGTTELGLQASARSWPVSRRFAKNRDEELLARTKNIKHDREASDGYADQGLPSSYKTFASLFA